MLSKKRIFQKKGEKAFRKFLEIDRKNSKKPSQEGYERRNCALACYPCNNAKSNVFSEREFKEIGKTIAKVIKGTN